jgi:hypothetical protein
MMGRWDAFHRPILSRVEHMKRIIEAALDDADIPFQPNSPFDFYLPVLGVSIHVLPAGAEARQLDQTDDVIVVRGRTAVNRLAAWIRAGKATHE